MNTTTFAPHSIVRNTRTGKTYEIPAYPKPYVTGGVERIAAYLIKDGATTNYSTNLKLSEIESV